jgi:hypothetical protein
MADVTVPAAVAADDTGPPATSAPKTGRGFRHYS